MEPTEEDDADDVDHEVDESSKRRDDEDPYAPDAGDAGKETLRMMTMKRPATRSKSSAERVASFAGSTMQSPRPAGPKVPTRPILQLQAPSQNPCDQQLYICVDYMLVF